MPDPIKPKDETNPTTTETPPADPPKTETPPAAPERDPLVDVILRDLGELPETEIKKVDEEPPKPDEAPKPADATPPAEPTKPAEPPPEPKKAKKKATILNVEPEIPQPAPTVTAPVAEPTPPAQPPKPAEDPDAAYIAGLNEEQKAELEQAEMAEKHIPSKYQGQRQKLLAWNKGFDAKCEALKKANPERTLDENDPEFMALVKTKPAIQLFDQQKVLLHVAEDRAVERIKREQKSEMDDVKRQTRATAIAPKVEEKLNEFGQGLTDFVASSEEKDDTIAAAAKLLKEGKEIPDELKLEASIFNETTTNAKALANRYMLLVNGATKFDADNPETGWQDRWILEFINRQGRAMQNAPAELRTRNGKTFLPREQFMALPATESPNARTFESKNHFTFSHRELMELMAVNASDEMKFRLKAENEAMERKGLERRKTKKPSETPKQETTTIAATETETTPPTGSLKAKPTALKGASSTGKTAPSTNLPDDIIDEIKILGLDKI